jgi:hypothetical protein
MALSRSAPTPRISRFRAIGSRPSGCACRPFNTRRANCLASIRCASNWVACWIQVDEVVSKNAQWNSATYGVSQRSAVLGFRPAAQRFGQRDLCRPYPTASGSLRQLAARLGLADRMAASSKPIFPKPSATAKTCASTGRPHLPERRGNRASPGRRRVPSNLEDFARRGDDVPRQPSPPTIKQVNQPDILRVSITHRSPTFPIDKHDKIMYIMLQHVDCDVTGPFFCRIG